MKLEHGSGKGCDGSSGCLGVVLTATIDLLVSDGNLKGSDGGSARVHFLLNNIYLGHLGKKSRMGLRD